ncbi:MAG: InlB B-repeat-containing protein [Firmicutes bacterium]|nr:InlB B-repeat-containing protein [Bacillota bacterium]
MNTPRRFRHSRIAALAFAGVFVVCAVVMGVVFSMNKSDTPSPEAATPSTNHIALVITNGHLATGSNTPTFIEGTATNAAITVGQMHISAPTTTVTNFLPANTSHRQFMVPITGGSARFYVTTRTITFPAGVSSFGHFISEGTSTIAGVTPTTLTGGTLLPTHVAGYVPPAPINFASRTVSIANRTTSMTVTQVMWYGQSRTLGTDYYGNPTTWSNWHSGLWSNGAIQGTGMFRVHPSWGTEHRRAIYTSPAVAATGTNININVAPLNTIFIPWQTHNRVPLAGNNIITNFAARTALPSMQAHITSQTATHLNVQVSLSAAAPFGMYLMGGFHQRTTGTWAQSEAAHNGVNVAAATVSHRGTINISVPQVNWNEPISHGTQFENAFRNRIHVVVGMYYHNANNATPTRPITFNLQSGHIGGDFSQVTVDVPNNQPVVAITDPQRAGHTFIHWSAAPGGSFWNFNTLISANNTINANNRLYAVWRVNPIVQFNTHGGSTVLQQEISYGGRIVQPGDPTRSGYSFRHWSNVQDGVTPWNFNNTVTTNMTLHAVFDEVVWRTIHLRVGNPLNDTSMTMTLFRPDGYLLQLRDNTPSQIDLDFLGWAWSADAARNKVIAFQPNGIVAMISPIPMTLYAVWDIEWNNFPGIDGHNTLVFNFSGGLNPHSIIVEERRFFAWDPSSRMLPNDEYMHNFAINNHDFNGLIFTGWFDNPGFVGQRHFSIPAGSVGEVRFYARWMEV